MSGTLARFGSVMLWLGLILSSVMFWAALFFALIDFPTTILVCVVVMGIGWGGWYAAGTRRSRVALGSSFTAPNPPPPRA
jgi:hypothetical protein